MFQSYFKIAYRNLWRHKLHTAINVIGLAIGISACLVIFLLVHFEQSFDRFHPDKERIYRITTKYSGLFSATNSGVAFPIAEAARKECTGVETAGHFITLSNLDVRIEGKNEPRKLLEEQNWVAAVEPEYFQVFKSYQWLAGNPEIALREPFKVVLTESRAKTYFGNVSPDQAIGREIVYNDSLRVAVWGIVADFKEESDLKFTDFISASTIPLSWIKNDCGGLEGMKEWGSTSSSSQAFVKLSPGTKPQAIVKQLEQLLKKNSKESDPNMKITYPMQPLSELRYSTVGVFNESAEAAHRPTLNALLLVALLLLVIACINFVNLTTAQAVQRSKEVGVRKVLGGTRSVLVFQFLGETLVVTSIAMLLSIVLAQGAVYFFKEFLPEGLVFNPISPAMLLFIGGTVLVVSLLAGLYPAFVLSAFQPVAALKNQFFTKGTGSSVEWLRKGLIVFQFTFSLALIAGTIIIGRQIQFMQNQDMGFNSDAIVHFSLPYASAPDKKLILKNELAQLSSVRGISLNASPPASSNVSTTIFKCKNGTDKDYELRIKDIDTAYLHLYQLPLVAGRNLQPFDSTREFLINEQAVHLFGFKSAEEAIGKELSRDKGKNFPIVGVVKDFHTRSLHEPIYATVMQINPPAFRYDMSLKLATAGKGVDAFKKTMGQIENYWKSIYPGEKFRYSFVDEDIAKFYDNERKMSKVMRTATGVAIFISCIGLFGLVSFTVARRTKEIGIRKILGASVSSIVQLLSRDLLGLVGISILLGSPIAWYFAHQWLQNFAFRIPIQWWIFVLAGLIALVIALGTVGYQAVRAAMVNPVKSLRSE
jgi:predicted permease